MLDRWSIMTYERSISLRKLSINQNEDSSLSIPVIQEFEDSVITHISAIVQTDKEDILINSAKYVCFFTNLDGLRGQNCPFLLIFK